MHEFQKEMLKLLVKQGIYPSPFIELSSWLKIYLPGWLDDDIMKELESVELKPPKPICSIV